MNRRPRHDEQHRSDPKQRRTARSGGLEGSTIAISVSLKHFLLGHRRVISKWGRPDRRDGPQPALMESHIERLCTASGLRMTHPRRVIARVLSEAPDHPDVHELYQRTRAVDPRISLATLYRTVRLFEQSGILERRNLGSRRARYEPSGEHDHFHLVDLDSDKVIEFDEPETDAGGLLRGGFVGDGAVIDWQFNTTDIAVVVQTDLVTEKYYRHYERQVR